MNLIVVGIWMLCRDCLASRGVVGRTLGDRGDWTFHSCFRTGDLVRFEKVEVMLDIHFVLLLHLLHPYSPLWWS